MVRPISRTGKFTSLPGNQSFPAATRLRIPADITRQLRNLVAAGNAITYEVVTSIAGEWLLEQQRIHIERHIKAIDQLKRFIRKIELDEGIRQKAAIDKLMQKSLQNSLSNIQSISGGKPSSTGLIDRSGVAPDRTVFRITVDDPTYIQRILVYADKQMRADLVRLIKTRFEVSIPIILMGAFAEVAAPLEDGAFPKEYLDGIFRVISSKGRFWVTGLSPQAIVVDVRDIFNELGDASDLQAGYHYGAAIAQDNTTYSSRARRFRGRKGLFVKFSSVPFRGRTSMNTVSLPYRGQPLRSGVQSRYQYWKAMYSGKTELVYGLSKGKKGKKMKVQIDPNAWEDTKEARVFYWNSQGKAPQWLLLEYGQTRYSPTIPLHTKGAGAPGPGTEGRNPIYTPGNVTKIFYDKLTAMWTTLVKEAWTEAWNHAQTRVKENPIGERRFNPFRSYKNTSEEESYVNWFIDTVERKEIKRLIDRRVLLGGDPLDLPYYYNRSRRKQNSVGGID